MLVLLLIAPLTGCLVKEDKASKVIGRSTDSVRQFVNGDIFQYQIYGQKTNIADPSNPYLSVSGTLTIQYANVFLIDPGTGSNYPFNVLQEDTELAMNGVATTTTRYLKQDSSTGALSVMAAKPASSTIRYASTTGTTTNPQPVELLPSPVPLTGNFDINYRYFLDCNPTCNEDAIMRDNITYNGNYEIATNVGHFNSIRYDFSSSTKPVSTGIFDIRGACGTTNTDYNGAAYIFPEVGVVFMDFQCFPTSGDSFTIRANLSSTNVPIPSS